MNPEQRGDGFRRNNEGVHYSFETVSLHVKQSFSQCLNYHVDPVNLRPNIFSFRAFEISCFRDYLFWVLSWLTITRG